MKRPITQGGRIKGQISVWRKDFNMGAFPLFHPESLISQDFKSRMYVFQVFHELKI